MPFNDIVNRRVFATKSYVRWSHGVSLPESACCNALREIWQGLVDADLGGGLLKKRVALTGRGKRGGARVIVGTDRGSRWIALDGYLKSEMEDLGPRDLALLRRYVADLLGCSAAQFDLLLAHGFLKEICHGYEQNQSHLQSGARRRH